MYAKYGRFIGWALLREMPGPRERREMAEQEFWAGLPAPAAPTL
jgi:hypothetical protein